MGGVAFLIGISATGFFCWVRKRRGRRAQARYNPVVTFGEDGGEEDEEETQFALIDL